MGFRYTFKDSLLRFGAILQYSQYSAVIHFTAGGTNMYDILITRQITRLSNDISNIQMGKRIFLKIT